MTRPVSVVDFHCPTCGKRPLARLVIENVQRRNDSWLQLTFPVANVQHTCDPEPQDAP